MVIYYVLLVLYNFLMSGQNHTNAAFVWPVTDDGYMNQDDTAGVSRDKPVVRDRSAHSIAVFKNNAPKTTPSSDDWNELASQHLNMMTSDSVRCATPRPKVIKVQEVHSFASKRYLPSCVTLHRCDHRTGCCDEEDHVCTAISKTRVPMYFFVVNLQPTYDHADKPESTVQHDLQVERLMFTNHTECGCRKRKIRTTPAPPNARQVSSGFAYNRLSNCLYFVIVTIIIANPFIIS